jgi:hypothetical protein
MKLISLLFRNALNLHFETLEEYTWGLQDKLIIKLSELMIYMTEINYLKQGFVS